MLRLWLCWAEPREATFRHVTLSSRRQAEAELVWSWSAGSSSCWLHPSLWSVSQLLTPFVGASGLPGALPCLPLFDFRLCFAGAVDKCSSSLPQFERLIEALMVNCCLFGRLRALSKLSWAYPTWISMPRERCTSTSDWTHLRLIQARTCRSFGKEIQTQCATSLLEVVDPRGFSG